MTPILAGTAVAILTKYGLEYTGWACLVKAETATCQSSIHSTMATLKWRMFHNMVESAHRVGDSNIRLHEASRRLGLGGCEVVDREFGAALN